MIHLNDLSNPKLCVQRTQRAPFAKHQLTLQHLVFKRCTFCKIQKLPANKRYAKMLYTQQQLSGGPSFSHKTRIGNWNEDVELAQVFCSNNYN